MTSLITHSIRRREEQRDDVSVRKIAASYGTRKSTRWLVMETPTFVFYDFSHVGSHTMFRPRLNLGRYKNCHHYYPYFFFVADKNKNKQKKIKKLQK